jgi:tetratricopeptide (TPR) repeat protein
MKFLVTCALVLLLAAAASAQRTHFGKLSAADQAYNQGLELKGNNDLDGAIVAFTRALELEKDYPGAYNNRGFVKMSKGDLDGAVADFTEAIRVEPKAFEGHYNRGSAYLMQEKFALALADLDQSIEIQPHDALAHHNRGNALHGLNRPDEAIAEFTKAIELYPLPEFYYSRAIDHTVKKEIDLALADYAKVIELKPDFARAYANRGTILMEREQDADALRDFDRAFQLDPSLHAELDDFIAKSRAAHLGKKRH